MRIYTKKSFRFDHPAKQAEPVIVPALSFVDVPDWVMHARMFQLASQDGDVTVIENAAQADAVERAAHEKPKRGAAKAEA